MGRCVVKQLDLVVAPPNHAPGAHHHGPDGHLLALERASRLPQGFAHEMLVFVQVAHASHPTAATHFSHEIAGGCAAPGSRHGGRVNKAVYEQFRASGAVLLRDRTVLTLGGEDRIRFLNGQATNDVARLKPGASIPAAICNAKGKMNAEVWIAAQDDRLWVDGPADLDIPLRERLERFVIADDVTITAFSGALAHAWGAAAGLFPGAILKSASARLGLDGWDILFEGAPPSDTPWATEEFAEILRVEAGLPRWRAELDEGTLPPEAGRETRWIAYDKGCYIGQEVVSRIRSVGHVNRLLKGLVREDGGMMARGETIAGVGGTAGAVTSAVWSPRLEKGIALGWIRRQDARDGSRVEVNGAPACVCGLPFVN